MNMKWSLFALLLIVVIFVSNTQAKVDDQVDSDAGLNVLQLIQKRGYHVEEHKVVTDDRYVLTMYRIPKSYQESQTNITAAPNKPAVYLIHGLMDSSYTYILNYRTQSLAYLLADAGYDVWLGNNRGTTWSNQHLDYSLSDARYWDFTWQEMAKFDMPAMLKYVLTVSGRPTLSYVGHSEGTMQAFAGFSTNQELAKKVSYFGALAPVAYLGDIKSPVFKALAVTYFDKLVRSLGGKAFSEHSPIAQDVIGKYGCAFVDIACNSIINLLTGPSNHMNMSRIHVYISQTFASTSVKNMAHFAQGIRKDTFAEFDYGCACTRWLPFAACPSVICKNKAVYGTFDPPSFSLESVRYPRMGFYEGSQDWLATERDISKLRVRLPSDTIVEQKLVNYNHLDFTWAYNASEVVYKDLMTSIKKYEGLGY